MSALRISTVNVRGLRQQKKRRQVFAFLHTQKRDIFCIQETHSVQGDEKLWKNEWGGKIIFNHGTSLSRGVCILFSPDLSFVVNNRWACNGGRTIILDICTSQRRFTLVCLYGPNQDDPDFFEVLNLKLSNFSWDSIILAGDFNFVFNLDLDKLGGNQRTNFKARDKCYDIMTAYDLVDIWRERNPSDRSFTWTSNISSDIYCRLDFFLISRTLSHTVSRVSTSASLCSDHSIVNLDINVSNVQRGPGFWKFNNSLLKDQQFLALITDVINNVKCVYTNTGADNTWEYMKYSIRKFTVAYSKNRAKERRKSERDLLKEISHLERDLYSSHSDYTRNKLLEARSKLQAIYDFKIRGIIVRSRARWVEEGERNTNYFLNLEKRNKSYNVIRKLIGNDGREIFENQSILDELTHFYHSLYTSDNCSSVTFCSSIDNSNKLSEENARSCDGWLSDEECRTALFSLKNGKSPGSDGLTVEFYKHFWPLIGDTVVNSLNCAYSNTKMSDEQGRAVITLIPKPNKDPALVKNYRPISLLNVDYKICSKALASRIKNVISFIINDNQTGFIKNRFIGENVRYILDSIDYCKDNNVPGFLLLVDFEKAFDRLEWGFIYRCLHFFNFNRSFIQWISTLYSNATSCVCNNGFSSTFFKVSRGVRQGCPISPYLFILCAEVLALRINLSPDIKGLSIAKNETRIIQYADDTCIFLDGSHSSVKAVVDIFEELHTSSGLRVNFEKSNIFPLGPLLNSKPNFLHNYGFSWTVSPVTALGITFDHCKDNLFRLNYPPKLSRLKNVLNLWSQRDLSPIGKITLVKSFGLSQLVYLFQILPNPPQNFVKELESYIFNFIWSGKPDKVKRRTLIAPISEGGLKATHVSSFINSLKCSWANRYLNDTKGSWKDFFDFYLKSNGKSFLFHCNFEAKDIKTDNVFINDVCAAWAQFNFKQPLDPYNNRLQWPSG